MIKPEPEARTMDTAATFKSATANTCEGIVLTALVAAPNFAGSVLILKLIDVRILGGAVAFVLFASTALALFTAWLGPGHPRLCKNYEPVFFDPTLYLEQKVQLWLGKPGTAGQLLKTSFMLGLLAIAAASIR